MGRRSAGRSENLRRRLALEAARIIDEQGVRDYRLAKQKAAQRLCVAERYLPTNIEVEEALAERLRLFAGAQHLSQLSHLRRTARTAMQLFSAFEPRLVGGVLSGTAPSHADVQLHLFADTSEQVAVCLLGEAIPFETTERRLKLNNGAHAYYPEFRFYAGETGVCATVFPLLGLRESPTSPIDGRPMRRARIDEVELLIESGEP